MVLMKNNITTALKMIALAALALIGLMLILLYLVIKRTRNNYIRWCVVMKII
jgi:hypothetical protein